MAEREWWERRWFLVLVIVASAIPLLLPETPPLVDVPGHMGRFRVQLDLANSPDLQRYFEFQWALIGNLGVDLLIIPLAPLFGLELAVKLIILTIPPLTVAGIFWVAKEIHGRIPPTSLFAVPFVYSFPFNFGFINFSLSLALCLLAFAFWLRLTRQGKFRLRMAIFVPISIALWITHAFGWGVLGLLAFASELVRQRDTENGWRRAIGSSVAAVLPLSLPIILMITGQGQTVAGGTGYFFEVWHKLYSLTAVLRDRWLIWDSFGIAAALLMLGAARFEPNLQFSRRLIIPAMLLWAIFLVMPGVVLGLAYADMRLGPTMFILALVAIRMRDGNERSSRRLAWIGITFVALRLIGNTISFGIADREARTWLTALDHIPSGAPVLSLVDEFCNARWEMPRHAHMSGFVITRRNGFSNNQWEAAGAQLLRVNYSAAGKFSTHRSTITNTVECLARKKRMKDETQAADQLTTRVLQRFPRDAFDYVWIIQPGDFDMRQRPGLTPIWRTNDAVLYRVDREVSRPN
ncbi:MAG: hypothetical protein ABIP07_07830 [Sphingomicrobium sp.]